MISSAKPPHATTTIAPPISWAIGMYATWPTTHSAAPSAATHTRASADAAAMKLPIVFMAAR